MSENRPDSQRLVNINSPHINGIYGNTDSLGIWPLFCCGNSSGLVQINFLGIWSFRDCILLGLCCWANLAWMKLHAYFSVFINSLLLLLLCQLNYSTGDAGGRDTLPRFFLFSPEFQVSIQPPTFHLWKTIRHHLCSSSLIHSSVTIETWIYIHLCQKHCNSWSEAHQKYLLIPTFQIQ